MEFIWHIIALIGLFLPATLAYGLVFGKGKIFHFGPVGVAILTAYAFSLALVHTQNFIAAFAAGILFNVLISLFFAWLALRLEPDGLGVMSIAVHLALLAVVLNWNGFTRGALGVPGIPRLPFLQQTWHFAVLMMIIGVILYFVMRRLDRSAFGRQLSALAEHEWYAKAQGISRVKVHMATFVIAGLVSSISSFLFPQYILFLHPNDYQFPALVFLVMIVVAGKPGSVLGVTISTALLVILKEALRFIPMAPSLVGPIRLLLFGLILFAAVWWRRDTLFPHQRKI